MAVTPRLKLPIPDLTGVADGPDAFSDLALALEDYVLDRVKPTGILHAPNHHWGSGVSYPVTGRQVGDTYFNSALRSLMVYTGQTVDWVQAHGPLYCTGATQRPPRTSYGLYEGFQIYIGTQAQVYTWDGTRWRNGAAGDQNPPGSSFDSIVTGRSGSKVHTLTGGGRVPVDIGLNFQDANYIAMGTPGSTGGNLGFVVADPASYTSGTASFLCYTTAGALVATGQTVRVNWSVVGYND